MYDECTSDVRRMYVEYSLFSVTTNDVLQDVIVRMLLYVECTTYNVLTMRVRRTLYDVQQHSMS